MFSFLIIIHKISSKFIKIIELLELLTSTSKVSLIITENCSIKNIFYLKAEQSVFIKTKIDMDISRQIKRSDLSNYSKNAMQISPV